jgi:hypothetical protein
MLKYQWPRANIASRLWLRLTLQRRDHAGLREGLADRRTS